MFMQLPALIFGAFIMNYREDIKSGNKLSVLGYGCMRFPRNIMQIDETKTEQLILKAVENGINYFDTAYIYGGSEDALGKIVDANNLRNKIYIATKLPLGKCQKTSDFNFYLNSQLNRLKTNYIDYYLLHNISSVKMFKKLCDLGIKEWIAKKKKEGIIKQIGFSFHGAQAEFLALLDEYDWDFCQIQYNYMNVNYQAGEKGLKKAAEKGLTVIVMEPLLGGALVNNLPKNAVKIFNNANANQSPAQWAFNWLYNQKEVSVVLSGMNSMQQLEENTKTAHNAKIGMLCEKDEIVYKNVITEFEKYNKVPCTGCAYCMPCPYNVNIPAAFSAYNISYSVGRITSQMQYITSTGMGDKDKNYVASNCKACKKCELLCPQKIEISQKMKDVKKRMEPFWVKPILKIIMKQMQKIPKKQNPNNES
jgi:predicted aldo/keto reductase-like oxidoreductase